MNNIRLFALAAITVVLMATPATAQRIQVKDLGLKIGFQDIYDGHLQRGRANIAADFNLDGKIDFYMGSPGDTSLVMENVSTEDRTRFKVAQVLVENEVAWGGTAFDYDNDGDYDLFITVGGNEVIGLDYMFKNLWIETGSLQFEDVTAEAGIAGPIPSGEVEPIPVASANSVAIDYDRDGDTDLFVNVSVRPMTLPQLSGRNVMWSNNGDGTFTDVTDQVGLGALDGDTRHSTFIDFDNDGDADLIENNFDGPNILRRNLHVETGTVLFEDATAEFSPTGEDLHFPHRGFVSGAADFNNDGWEDYIVFYRGRDKPEIGSPYPAGHALFLNQAGEGFVNVANQSGLNNPYISAQGVMGSQVGDVNFDGTPDVFIGNGAPPNGQFNQLYLSRPQSSQQPEYLNRTELIDFEAQHKQGLDYPAYPYRTHGTTFVDVDSDGSPEIMVSNGGPSGQGDQVREPNRAFKLRIAGDIQYLWVRPVGDGVNVALDAVGTRIRVDVNDGNGSSWSVYRTLFGGNAFSAQSGFELFFGLKDAVSVDKVTVKWPDGTTKVLASGAAINSKIVVNY